MKTFLLLIPLTLGACGLTPQGTLFEEWFRSKAATAYDGGLENAMQFICNDASVGSIIRKFMVTEDTAKAWMELCFTNRDSLQTAVVDKINKEAD